MQRRGIVKAELFECLLRHAGVSEEESSAGRSMINGRITLIFHAKFDPQSFAVKKGPDDISASGSSCSEEELENHRFPGDDQRFPGDDQRFPGAFSRCVFQVMTSVFQVMTGVFQVRFPGDDRRFPGAFSR
ncbi:uncharacterized protein V6R79_016170 [Siganus canaliculatus]